MSCIYNGCGWDNPQCQMYCEELKGTYWENSEYGWDKDGCCVCDEDPDPYYSCTYYESEYRDEDE